MSLLQRFTILLMFVNELIKNFFFDRYRSKSELRKYRKE